MASNACSAVQAEVLEVGEYYEVREYREVEMRCNTVRVLRQKLSGRCVRRVCALRRCQ
jgi:hypothetical protein